LLQLLQRQPTLGQHLEELQEFLALEERVMAVQQNNVRKEEAQLEREQQRANKVQTSGGEKNATKGDPMPMDEIELQQADAVVQQLWRLVANAQQDVRFDDDIQ
jgi:hypothetical protein